jgi:hypothetical protein
MDKRFIRRRNQHKFLRKNDVNFLDLKWNFLVQICVLVNLDKMLSKFLGRK